MNITPFLSINRPCNELLPLVMQELSRLDLHPTQTFDLNIARLAMRGCSCPNHGTNACDCQMVVLLVYGKAVEPATVILHGNDGRTWVSIVNDPQQRVDAKMMTLIQQALEVKPPVSASK